MTEAAPPAGASPAKSGVRILSMADPPRLAELGDVEVRGGFGGGLAPVFGGDGFWLLSGRGPVYDTGKPFEKGFALPSFAPSIARVRVHGESLALESKIELRATSGRRLSGLPNPLGEGGTGEAPVTWDGRPLPLDRDGLHPRGLVALSDGTFWVADAYGPHLLHIDASGRTIDRIGPFDRVRRLPRVLARRAPNRGFAGLTVTPDESTLVAIVESPLENPRREAGGESRITRILAFDIASGSARQYLYPQEDTQLSNAAILALSATEFLVIERDAFFPNDPRKPSWIKRIYRIDIEEATDVSDPIDGEAGRMVGGRTMEELAPDELRAGGVQPVTKALAVDLLALGYPHDKPAGLAMYDSDTLAVLNDDDFGIASPGRWGGSRVEPKVLPGTERISESELWLIPLPASADVRRS